MQAAPLTPPVPAAQAEARRPGESLPRESATPGAHLPPQGEEHSSPGLPETLLDTDNAALQRERREEERRVLLDELSKQKASQRTLLKITLGRWMPATAWEAQGSGSAVDSDRRWQDVAIRKHFKGSD